MKPKYYKLDEHFEGVGITPQHQSMGESYDYDAPDSVHNLSFDELLEFDPNFNTILLDDRAIITDLISSAPIQNCGLLISGRLRLILDSFLLPLHKYYTVPVKYHGKNVPDYWWLHLPQPPLSIPTDSSPLEAEGIIQACEALHDVAMFRLYRPM